MANETLKTASVLAFERKLDPSDALFYSGHWSAREDASAWQPVALREKSVRGTASHRVKAKKGDGDLLKRDMKVESPNPQRVDVATLPADADTLKVHFTMRVLSGVGEPSACNLPEYRTKLIETVNNYLQNHGLGELAGRYAANLANGRFLWRNRIGAEQVEVQVAHLKDGAAETVWRFQALDHEMRTLSGPEAEAADITALSELMESGLSGRARVLLEVTAFVRVGAGQEVYPSQELIMDRDRVANKSKTLYDVNGVAGIHSQKLGNAIRTIDTWYPGADELGPIAVEPYGSVTTQGKAYRQPKEKQDFYNLLDRWLLKDEEPAVPNQHFVMAVLVRGGVFGDAG
jgi:CRISPR-associated protein Csy3